MTSADFNTTILVDQTPEAVFKAASNVRGWWSESIEGNTDQLNEEFLYYYKDVHISKMKIIEYIPGKMIVWQVLNNHFSFTKDKTEWNGNRIVFEITPKGDKTELRFTQEGLTPANECYSVCHDAWTSYIQGSLKDLITTGKGKPNAKEGGLNEELIEKWKLPRK
ncbi:SRPBCC family protein [Sediminibacterium ginsengisoli]|uniref:Activator of Hsp90 ATPase homolog 1-like protein n=1 Tax=Sediminibacterium ginsengisoli TaxID=413434 RepID=A0A1T4L9N3_9BACT|nr:SRPBCC domain-containing protein [Sediminibacterium ginsengisoli]SJZ51449.1 Activator of Hsp90 ATPase homolog 1-like protein [Sediminibacterium ginsengisoli]